MEGGMGKGTEGIRYEITLAIPMRDFRNAIDQVQPVPVGCLFVIIESQKPVQPAARVGDKL